MGQLHKLLQLPFRICYEPRHHHHNNKGNGGSKKKTWWQRTAFYSHLIRKRPWYIATCLPLLFIWAVWFPCIGGLNLWHLFTDRYFVVVAMLFASLIAGYLSQGTGGLSFPVMTLLFGITPRVARDFALLTQAIVLSGSTFAITYQSIPLETNSILFASAGGAFGLVFALQWVAPFVSDAVAVMNFVSLWIGFGAAAFWLSRKRDKETHTEIPNCSNWKALVLLVTGFGGGMLTAMFGSGLDLSVYSCLTLLFSININTAAPTGLVIQMINSLVAVGFKLLFMDGFTHEAFVDWVISLPFVTVGAALGTVGLSLVSRMPGGGASASIIYYMVSLTQFIYAVLVLPTDQADAQMVMFIVVAIIVGSTGVFLLLSKLGEKLIDVENKGYVCDEEDDEDEDEDDVEGNTDDYELIDEGSVSCESLPSMEELRARKMKMEQRANGSSGELMREDGEEFNSDGGGWSPYGRRTLNNAGPPSSATSTPVVGNNRRPSLTLSDASRRPTETTRLLAASVAAYTA